MEKYEEDFDYSHMRDDYQQRFLATSCYANAGDDYRCVSISGDKGKKVNFDGKSYSVLAPKKEFWKIWHDNIGKISDEDNLKYYIEKYYKQVLSKINLSELEEFLFGFGNERILLCYEEPKLFCHRHIVVAWIQLLYGIEIPEVKLCEVKYGEADNYVEQRFVSVERYPLEKITSVLETLMRESIGNMKGFKSLMAFRLFEKSNELDYKAYKLERETGNDYGMMHMTAAGLRVEADDSEEEYRRKFLIPKERKLIK